MANKLKTRCFSRSYLKPSAFSSHLSVPTLILDTAHQEKRYHQGRGNELLRPLARQEGLSTQSIRTRERLGGLLKYYHHKAA